MRTTRRVLGELGLDDRPVLTVFNKIDRLEDPRAQRRAEIEGPGALFISAATGAGLEDLRRALEEAADEGTVLGEATLPPGAGSAIARIHSLARVLGSRLVDGKMEIRYRARREDAGVLAKMIREAGGHPS
jgi:GTP-binding protein HflX